MMDADEKRDERNMYDCTPCPKCGKEFRFPMRDGLVHCDDCGHVEPFDAYITARYGGEDVGQN